MIFVWADFLVSGTHWRAAAPWEHGDAIMSGTLHGQSWALALGLGYLAPRWQVRMAHFYVCICRQLAPADILNEQVRIRFHGSNARVLNVKSIHFLHSWKATFAKKTLATARTTTRAVIWGSWPCLTQCQGLGGRMRPRP